MARRLRFQPEPRLLFEITIRCLGGQMLLRPSKLVNEIIGGVLGRAAQLYGEVDVVAFVALSNHAHLACAAEDSQLLSRFVQFVKSNIAREINRVLGRSGTFWERRYSAIAIPLVGAKMEERFRYLLSQSAKENLVERIVQWPGIHFGRCLINEQPIEGVWVDRTKAWKLRRMAGEGKKPRKKDFATKTSLELAPLPCWRHLSAAERRAKVIAMVSEIEAEARALRKRNGGKVLGVERILEQSPFTTPVNPVRPTRAPLVHAEGEVFIGFRHAYRNFVAAFRQAAELLRDPNRKEVIPPFPIGSFPPGLPFVRGIPPPWMLAA